MERVKLANAAGGGTLKGALRRRLRGLIDVRPGEYARAAAMALYLLFVMLAYYILKPVSRSLFITEFDAVRLPYLYLAVAVSGGILAYLYTRAAVRWSLRYAVHGTIAFVVISLLEIWELLESPGPWLFYVLNIWVSLFSLVLVSQGWLISANIFSVWEARRLYGFLAGCSVLGAAFGGSFTAKFAAQIGTRNLLLVSAAFVLLAWLSYLALLRMKGVNLGQARAAEQVEQEFTMSDFWVAVKRYRHLQIIIAIIAITYIVDTLVEYQFSNIASVGRKGDALTSFFGGFYGVWLNLATFFVQIFLTSQIVKRFGVSGTLLVMPVGIGAASCFMLAMPGVWAAGAARLIEASTRYSFNRTGMELLYLPLPDDLKNRTKVFVDVFVDRVARGFGAILILAVGVVFGKQLTPVTLMVVLISLAWIVLASYAKREYTDLVRERLKQARAWVDRIRVPYQDPEVVRFLEESAVSHSQRQTAYALEMLEQIPDYRLEPLLVRIAGSPAPDVRALAYDYAARLASPALEKDARAELEAEPSRATQAALHYLWRLNPADPPIAPFLSSPDPRLLEAAIAAGGEIPAAWVRQAVESPDPQMRRLGALALQRHPAAAADLLPKLFQDRSAEVRRTAARVLGEMPDAVCARVASMAADPSAPQNARLTAIRALGRVPRQAVVEALSPLLSSEEAPIRAGAMRALERIRDRELGVVVDHGLVTQQVRRESKSWFEVHAAMVSLEKVADHTPAVRLLIRTLKDRLERPVERQFRLLGLRYPPRDISAARRAIRKGTSRDLAHAIDFLDTILDPELKRFVLPLVDSGESPEQAGLMLFGISPAEPESVLREMIRHGDAWLRACAIAAAAEMKMARLAGEIRAAAAFGPQVAAVAAAALSSLEEPV
jgi:AAA family ATP:ADP antiporter